MARGWSRVFERLGGAETIDSPPAKQGKFRSFLRSAPGCAASGPQAAGILHCRGHGELSRLEDNIAQARDRLEGVRAHGIYGAGLYKGLDLKLKR